jgi:hypothetical protein
LCSVTGNLRCVVLVAYLIEFKYWICHSRLHGDEEVFDTSIISSDQDGQNARTGGEVEGIGRNETDEYTISGAGNDTGQGWIKYTDSGWLRL